MQLEDYLEIEKLPTGERIRVKGTRIGIEHIIEPYLGSDSPERIFHNYRHSLSLEQVYATITYYLHNREAVDVYLERGRKAGEEAFQEYIKKEPSELAKRLRALAAERQASST